MTISREEQIAANLKERAEIQADLTSKGNTAFMNHQIALPKTLLLLSVSSNLSNSLRCINGY